MHLLHRHAELLLGQHPVAVGVDRLEHLHRIHVALAVGETSIVKHLEHNVEDIRVGLITATEYGESSIKDAKQSRTD